MVHLFPTYLNIGRDTQIKLKVKLLFFGQSKTGFFNQLFTISLQPRPTTHPPSPLFLPCASSASASFYPTASNSTSRRTSSSSLRPKARHFYSLLSLLALVPRPSPPSPNASTQALFWTPSGLTSRVPASQPSTFYHLRLISRIRRFLNLSATKALDYCNSLLAGLPDKTIAPLQRVQNAAARLTLLKDRSVSSSQLLKELGLLLVKQRITFKTATLAFRCGLSPPLTPKYLSSLLSPHVPSRSLRTSKTKFPSVPRIHLSTYGERSFSFLLPPC